MKPVRSIAWFLPAYNEADNLPFVVSNIHLYLQSIGCPFTIIVVNDGSLDNTAGVAENISQIYPEVDVVSHQVNQGYGAALRTGLKAGLEAGHDLIGFCDADGQFLIDSLGPMLNVIEQADAVLGYRLRRADGLRRRLMGRGWHHVSRLVLGYKARDVDCGFKLFRREVVDSIMPKLRGDYATISPELIVRIQRAGFQIEESPVEHRPRHAGEQSGADIKVIWRSFRGLISVKQLIRNEG